jgi:aspartate carbamoyltransferase
MILQFLPGGIMLKHLLSVDDLTGEEVMDLLRSARNMERDWDEPFYENRKVLATFFAEPSTRTRLSFERAMHHLGGRVLTAADASVSSSLAKGESLKDTFRTLGQYCDAIVMRHKDVTWTDHARRYSRVPVINAGNGGGEHPTQALLDLHTIHQELHRVTELAVMICGDLTDGRTAHSLVKLLQKFGNKIYLAPARRVCANGYKYDMLMRCHDDGCIYIDHQDQKEVLKEMDVVYMTRLQKERWEVTTDEIEYLRLDRKLVSTMKQESIILHPLPRQEEIAEEVDDDPRAAYHERQVRNGVFIRAALLEMMLYQRTK